MSDINAHESYYDPSNGVVVTSEVSPEEVGPFLRDKSDLLDPRVYRALANWAEESGRPSRRDHSIFSRDRYVTPSKIFEQMAVAYDALDDDLVGNVADTSEAIAFQKVEFESSDEDQEDVWGQIGRDLDLDGWMRQAWRELFTVSQFYGVRYWGRKKYDVRGTRDKRQKRKSYDIFVPVALGFLDPTRVVPVGVDLFGRAQLAWIGTDNDLSLYGQVKEGTQNDSLVANLFVGPYTPSEKEKGDLEKEGVPTERLMLLNSAYVFRHTVTRSPFERWARLRMKSVFPLLDLKHQLREMDRAWLLGGINFLVLVTRGTDEKPTTTAEVQATATQVRTQSRTPIIVTDHRINVEIISPQIEHVLQPEKWTVLDERIMMRLWGTFQLPSETSTRETSISLGRVIARGLGSRRHMLKRTLERELIRAVTENPLNIEAGFTEETSLEFAPRRMELEFDSNMVTLLQELRDRGDLSRETILNEFNFDQGLEARRREVEKEKYDKIFTPVNVPFDSPDKTTPGGAGRKGGRPAGSGTGGGNGGEGTQGGS
jgi:hypothetical protein